MLPAITPEEAGTLAGLGLVSVPLYTDSPVSSGQPMAEINCVPTARRATSVSPR